MSNALEPAIRLDNDLIRAQWDVSGEARRLGLAFLGFKGTARIAGKQRQEGFPAGATTWDCNISTKCGRGKIAMTMGSGHKGRAPTLSELAESMISDASVAECYPTPEDLISEGMVGLDDDGAMGRARRLAKGCAKSKALLDRLLGPLAKATSAPELAGLAAQMCLADPALKASSSARPVGYLELAVAAEDPAILARAIGEQTRIEQLDRALAFARGLARQNGSYDYQEELGMIASMIEAREIEAGLERCARKARSSLSI